jgi:intraflagellar transport protein 172
MYVRSRVALGSVCGGVDLYDACVKKQRFKGAYDFTYVSDSQVIITKLADGARSVIKSNYGCEIVKLSIFQDRFAVANTTRTLIVGDLETKLVSEIQWVTSGKEKYYFDHPSICLVFSAGELSLIEYGNHELLGCCRTEHMNPRLIR